MFPDWLDSSEPPQRPKKKRKPAARKRPGLQLRRSASPQAIRTKTLLGDGGQGEVFEVLVDGVRQAAKVYHRDACTPAQRAVLKGLLSREAPSSHFLWPTAFIETSDETRFGYLMPLRAPRFHDLAQIVSGEVPIGFAASLEAATQLAEAFRLLHASGLAYRDINLNNIFIDPATGEVLICDTDNVGTDGGRAYGVLGTSGFMAPEIERGEATPTAATDRHSLAVLLFLLLVRHHPLEGARIHDCRCLDATARRLFYGDEPLYVFHPTDTRNRAVDGDQPNPRLFSGIYPEVLWETFNRAFTDGLHEPSRRVTESAWIRTLTATRDLLMTCRCGVTTFANSGSNPLGAPRMCWSCKRSLAGALVLRIPGGILGDTTIAVSPDKPILARHLGRTAGPEETPIGTFIRHPTLKDVIGLRNDTDAPWTMTPASGEPQPVAPGRAALAADGVTVDIGGVLARFGRCDGGSGPNPQ